MNHITEFRLQLQKDFEEFDFKKEDSEVFRSTSGLFRIETTEYTYISKERNYSLTEVTVYNQTTRENIFNFLVNERCFHGWVKKEDVEYLICAEDIFGGQTIVNLTDRAMVGYSPNEDGFIWTDFHLSPDGKTLATIGCYWACPSVIKLFDFSNPSQLPLKEIKEIELLDNDEIITGWMDNTTIKMKGIQRERVAEYSDKGSFRMKILSETEVAREIKIDY